MNDTICAISSGYVNQAISIIRIVGPEATKIIKKIFTGKIGKNKTIEYGFIIDENKNKIDEVLVNFFIGNDNFVGEDTIEINAHGGIIVTKKILELIIMNGARLANPGEFTRRAYLNKKISLIKAEAINDLINSKTSQQHKIAINSFDKQKELLINKLINSLEYLIGLCEINIDYPEYDDIPILENNEFIEKIYRLNNEIEKIIKISEAGTIYSNSLSVVIVGNPNAGKSALLNALLNEEKSIVTNIPGTTRDVVESEIVFNNLIFRFKDTAGIRKSNNQIEKLGIKKSWNEIEKADIVLHVIDITKGINEIDEQIKKSITNQRYLQIWNKIDQVTKEDLDKNKIYISATEKKLDNLIEALNKIFSLNEFNSELAFNIRQITCLKKAKSALNDIIKGIQNKQTFDVLIIDLHLAWESLKELTGNVDKEELLDSIFKNFCLGK